MQTFRYLSAGLREGQLMESCGVSYFAEPERLDPGGSHFVRPITSGGLAINESLLLPSVSYCYPRQFFESLQYLDRLFG